MAERTKAEFRALREIVGLTQAALADELGVQVRSVKRWELPAAPQRPPQDAWDVLDEAVAAQRQVVSYALGKVDELAMEHGDYPKEVSLPYWSSAEHYRQGHSVPDVGDWRMANANNRAVALALRERGIPVSWVDVSPVPKAED